MPRVGSSSRQDVHVVMQQPRESDLLLVAARQFANRLRGRRAFDRRVVQPTATPRSVVAPATQVDAGPIPLKRVRVRLSATSRPSATPSAFAIFADHPHALCPAGLGRRAARVARRRGPGPIAPESSAEDGAQQFGAAGADEPGDAENLAAMQRERRRAGFERRRRRAPPRRAAAAIAETDRSRPGPTISRTMSSGRHRRGSAARDAAVAQDDDAIADLAAPLR